MPTHISLPAPVKRQRSKCLTPELKAALSALPEDGHSALLLSKQEARCAYEWASRQGIKTVTKKVTGGFAFWKSPKPQSLIDSIHQKLQPPPINFPPDPPEPDWDNESPTF